MTKSSRYPSYVDCVVQILSQSKEPMTLDALVTSVAGQRPITRNARGAISRALEQLYQAVPMPLGHFGWLSSILTGSMFRHPLANDEAKRGFLLLDELEHAVFFPEFFQCYSVDNRTLTIELLGGPTVQAWTEVERQIWSLRLGEEFVEWLDNAGAMGKDDLLISVIDAANGRYGMRVQPREVRDTEVIQQRNLELAKLATELVHEAANDGYELAIWGLAARLIGHKFYINPVPPDELHFVLQKFSSLNESERGVLYPTSNFTPPGEGMLAWEYSGKKLAERSERSIFDFTDEGAWGIDEEADWQDIIDDDPFLPDDDLFLPDIDPMHGWNPEQGDEVCDAYAAYLEALEHSSGEELPLSHDDFHLLEAELETLANLEREFGYLLPDQYARKDELAERLFIDPETLVDPGWDDPDAFGYDGPPFWNN